MPLPDKNAPKSEHQKYYDDVDLNIIHADSTAAGQALLRAMFAKFGVGAFNQTDILDARFGAGHEWSGGVCVGLSLVWIKKYKANKSEARTGAGGSMTKQEVVNDAVNLHAFYETERAGDKVPANATTFQKNVVGVTEAADFAGVRLDGDMVQDKLDSIPGRVSKSGKFSLVMLANGLGLGHATAAYCSSGNNLHFFDPNLAEFKIGTGDLKRFLEVLLAMYRLRKMEFTMLYFVHITP